MNAKNLVSLCFLISLQTVWATPSEPTFSADLKLFGFEPSQSEKVNEALKIIKRVIRKPLFRQRVLDFSHGGKKQFVDNLGLSNAQVLKKILAGAEELLPAVDHEMDLELELYYAAGTTVGYTYPDRLRIYVNTKYFDAYSPAEVAGNIFHEWIHKLGFDHSVSWTEDRSSSVPYALGYLMEELGGESR